MMYVYFAKSFADFNILSFICPFFIKELDFEKTQSFSDVLYSRCS